MPPLWRRAVRSGQACREITREPMAHAGVVSGRRVRLCFVRLEPPSWRLPSYFGLRARNPLCPWHQHNAQAATPADHLSLPCRVAVPRPEFARPRQRSKHALRGLGTWSLLCFDEARSRRGILGTARTIACCCRRALGSDALPHRMGQMERVGDGGRAGCRPCHQARGGGWRREEGRQAERLLRWP